MQDNVEDINMTFEEMKRWAVKEQKDMKTICHKIESITNKMLEELQSFEESLKCQML